MAFLNNNNTFLASLTNLCLQVLTFDNLQFSNRYGVFARQYTKWGDKIACVNAWVADGEDYNTSNADFTNPYKAKQPDVVEVTIETKLKKRYSLKLSEELLRGAFEDENSLGMFLSTLVAQLRTKAEIDIYAKICDEFATLDLAGAGVGNTYRNVSGDITTSDGVTALYSKIIETAQSMKLPNTIYGLTPSGKSDDHSKEVCAENTRLVLFLNPEAYAQIMTYVNASLFNSVKIDFDKWIDEVRVVDVETNPSTDLSEMYGFLCTEDVYRYSPRIETIREQPNGADLTLNYFYHLWTNMGFTGAGQLAYIGKA